MANRGELVLSQSSENLPVILHIVSYDVSRGAERYARALVDALNQRGDQNNLLMTMFEGDEENLGADVELGIPRGRLRSLGFDPRVVLRMRRSLRRLRPAVIVAHGGEPAKYVSVAAGRSTPFVYLVIGSSHPLLRRSWRRLMRDFYVQQSAAIVTVSAGLEEEMRESGVSGAKLHVIPNGRDPAVYATERARSGDSPRAIFVGHLDDQKRPQLFVSVMAEMRRRGVDSVGTVVGDGPLLSEVSEAAAAAEIEVLGQRDDVPALLAKSDLLVMTSRPPEGMPGVLIEAGMSGVAVVTTDVPGARDVVIDGTTGLVVGVDDQPGLMDAVERLLADRELRHEMGTAARARCAAQFSLQASADRWNEVLEEVRS